MKKSGSGPAENQYTMEHQYSGDNDFSVGDSQFSIGDNQFSVGDNQFSRGDNQFPGGDKQCSEVGLKYNDSIYLFDWILR